MSRFDARCTECGWAGEITAKFNERPTKCAVLVYANDPNVPQIDRVPCGGELEYLIGATPPPIVRHPLGFAPGVITADHKVHNAPRRRPAGTQKTSY